MNYNEILYKSNNLIGKIKSDLIELLQDNFSYDIIYRIKSEEHLLRKYKQKEYRNLEDIEDIIGFRILLDNEKDCEKLYHILCDKYTPYKISNYFKNPKETGFKAYLLKIDYYDINLEIQIMTYDMNEITEKTHQYHENKKYS